MEQRCHLSMIWLTWLGLPALAVIAGVYKGWTAGVFILVVGVLAQIAYVKWFPSLSRFLGYGSVVDTPAGLASGEAAQGGAPALVHDAAPAQGVSRDTPFRVTLYTANVCPFCPIVRKRLRDLRSKMGFELHETDVTFRPGIVREKGLSSVPVVEANGRFLIGNATSAELAAFLMRTGV